MAKSKPHQLHPDANHPLFTTNPAFWESTSSAIHSRSYHKDDRIILHGDKAISLWLVYQGWVKLSRQTPDGKETIVGLCTEGDVFGEASLFPNANYPYTAEIVGDSAVLASIPISTIRTSIEKNTSLTSTIMTLLNERTAQAQLKLEHMNTMSAAQRLGCFLLRLCHAETEGKKTLQIPVEKHILAAYLGMKPETFSRSQQQLKTVGISVSGNSITIENIGKLRDFVCNSCSESGACEVEALAD